MKNKNKSNNLSKVIKVTNSGRIIKNFDIYDQISSHKS